MRLERTKLSEPNNLCIPTSTTSNDYSYFMASNTQLILQAIVPKHQSGYRTVEQPIDLLVQVLAQAKMWLMQWYIFGSVERPYIHYKLQYWLK